MKTYFIAAALFAARLAAPLQAAPVDIHLDRNTGKAILGFSDVVSEGKNIDSGSIESIQKTIEHDLQFSNVFTLIKDGPLVKKRQDALAWAKLGTEIVFTGVLDKSKDSIEMSVKLLDTGTSKELLNTSLKRPLSQSRVLAHDAANEIFKYFTGQAGVFNSKIAVISDATGRKELYFADYDGRNPKRVTNDNSIVILPRISPDGQKVVFTSYVSGNPDLYLMNIDGSGRRKLSSKAGLNVSPSWSPDNQKLAVTLSIDGPPNIYLMDLQGHVERRITDSQGADTAPSFSPDGNQLAFTSDRAGAPHIFIMNLDGSGLRRITTEGHCDSPAWSPDGQTIVFVKSTAKRFDLYSIEVLTGIERRLTWGDGDSENPAWAPDGRSIIFVSNRRGKYQLFSMSPDGTNQTPIFINNGQVFTPHWSN